MHVPSQVMKSATGKNKAGQGSQERGDSNSEELMKK
jgi:hypothetical protein